MLLTLIIVGSSKPLTYFEEFDIKVRDAITDQGEKWMNDDKDYRVAVESGNIVEDGRIGNMFTEKAKEVVYPAMVYV